MPITTVTGYTAERMQEIEDNAVVDGNVVGNDLILVRNDATTINAGNVRGPQGPEGPNGAGETMLQGVGIDLTGVTDSSVAVQALITAADGPVLGVPGATYKFGDIDLKDGSDIRGNKATLISTAVFGGGAFVSTGRTKVSVSGWTGSGVNGSSLLKMLGGSIVDCLDNDFTTAQVFACSDPTDDYATSSIINTDILIQGNRGTSGTGSPGTAGIALSYCSDVVVNGNDITGYGSGCRFWGGDANFAVDGAIANDRKCKRIYIFGNKFKNSSVGGAWGSMGQYVRIWRNYVSGMGDVGIDGEGVFDFRVFGNTVIDCVTANYATFSLCRDVNMHNNTSVATTPGATLHLYLVKNETSDASKATGNGIFTFTDNSGYVVTGIGSMVRIESCRHLIFTGNTLRNTKLYTNVNNMHDLTICDNDLTWDDVALVAFRAIEIGKNNQIDAFPASMLIKNNKLISEELHPSGSFGIYSDQIDTNSSPFLEITENHIYGFTNDIFSAWSGANAGMVLVARIWNNVLQNGITYSNAGAATPQNIRTWGNRTIFTDGPVTGGASLSVSGSRGGNAALASLLTHLATLNLIVDGSSA